MLRTAEIKKWSNCAVRGSQGEDRRRGVSHRDTLRLGVSVGDGRKGHGIGGFDACNACSDARRRDDLERELTDERDQDVSYCSSNGGIRRSTWFVHVVSVRLRPAVDSIQGIVDGLRASWRRYAIRAMGRPVELCRPQWRPHQRLRSRR